MSSPQESIALREANDNLRLENHVLRAQLADLKAKQARGAVALDRYLESLTVRTLLTHHGLKPGEALWHPHNSADLQRLRVVEAYQDENSLYFDTDPPLTWRSHSQFTLRGYPTKLVKSVNNSKDLE